MPPRFDVENIVGGESQACLAFRAKGPDRCAGVDQRESRRCRFKRSKAVLLGSPFDFGAQLKTVRFAFNSAKQSQRRDPRRKANASDCCTGIIADPVDIDGKATKRCDPCRKLGFDAIIARIGLCELEHRQIVYNRARRGFVNIIRKPVVISRNAKAEPRSRRAQRCFDTIAHFLHEIGIADLECLRPRMRPIGEQFLGCRRAFGVRSRNADPNAVGQRIACPQRAR